jgi:hypothetical protein
MDKDRLRANQPAPDRAPAEATLDPNEFWSPQPSRVYTELNDAAAEGAAKPSVDPITEADMLMAERQDTTGGCAAQGNSPFVIADHEQQHTDGDLKTDLEFDIGLRSGQGQSGHGEPPVILPNVGGTRANEVSVITLPIARPRQGT